VLDTARNIVIHYVNEVDNYYLNVSFMRRLTVVSISVPCRVTVYIPTKGNGHVARNGTSDPTILFVSQTLISALSCRWQLAFVGIYQQVLKQIKSKWIEIYKDDYDHQYDRCRITFKGRHVPGCLCILIHSHIHAYIYIYIYIYIYPYLHTYTHTQALCSDIIPKWTRSLLYRLLTQQ
jgi:hypothetical protein